MEKEIHFSLKEKFVEAGSSVRLASVSLCGKTIMDDRNIAWSPAQVTCSACRIKMPQDFGPRAA